MNNLSPQELERYLLNFTEDTRYVTATRLPTYLQLMTLMSQAADEEHARGIGYHKRYGWFILERGPQGPQLIWSEKGE